MRRKFCKHWPQTTAVTSTTPPTTATIGSSTPPLSPSPSPSAETADTLSKGAIGGIAVGAVIAVIIIVGAIYYFLRKRRASPEELPAYPPGDSSMAYHSPDAAGYYAQEKQGTYSYHLAETVPHPVHELGEGARSELATSEHERHELMGDSDR
jgi:hypothetical protein